MLPIKKTTGKVDLSKIRALVLGEPKIGKSSWAISFPDSLLLATQKGYESLECFALNITKWDETSDAEKKKGNYGFVETLDEIVAGNHKYKTIIIDVADILYDLCDRYICSKLGIEHVSEGGYGKAYDMTLQEFSRQLGKLFTGDYGVIFITHAQVVELTTRGGKVTKVVSTLQKRANQFLRSEVGAIGYMSSKLMKTTDGKFVDRRVIRWRDDEFVDVGTRYPWMPTELVLSKDPTKGYEQLKQHYIKFEKGGQLAK
jgi:hypothetical protein